MLDTEEKANVFLQNTFGGKYALPAKKKENNVSARRQCWPASEQATLDAKARALHFLKTLDADSGTGPDLLPSRILKACCEELAEPVGMLAEKN